MYVKIIIMTIMLLFINPIKVNANDATPTPTISAEEFFKTSKNIKTNYVTMDTFLDCSETISILTKPEIEKLYNETSEKTFSDLELVEIDHENKLAIIKFKVNEDDGNIDTLVNTSIYNFFKSTNHFSKYDVKFEITGRYTDENGRYLKKLLYQYTFNSETIANIDWDSLEVLKTTEYSDLIWNQKNGNTENKDKQEDSSLQVKILNILKYYISEKINN